MDTAIDLEKLFRHGNDAERLTGVDSETYDDRMVQRAVKGDDEAFRLLVERHQEKVYHFCCQWLPDKEDAREATQDTFVRAYQAIERYQKKAEFSSWLFRIALNLCRDSHKSKAAKKRRKTQSFVKEDREPEFLCSKASPDEVAMSSGDLDALREGINSLPPKLRAVVIICGIEGMSQEICAEILNISVRAVEGRFYRARRALEQWLEK